MGRIDKQPPKCEAVLAWTIAALGCSPFTAVISLHNAASTILLNPLLWSTLGRHEFICDWISFARSAGANGQCFPQ